MLKLLKPKVLGASLVGAGAGYATNYAVSKLLFVEKQNVDVAGRSIPIKGILPPRQEQIANNVEKIINRTIDNPKLYPKLQETLTKPDVKDAVLSFMIKLIYETGDKKSINEFIRIFLKDEKKKKVEEDLKKFISKILSEKTDKEYLGAILTEESMKIFKEVADKPILSKLLNEKVLSSIANAISVAVHKFVETKATQKILDITFKEVDSLMDMSLAAVLKYFSLDEVEMRKILDTVYDAILFDIVPEIKKNVDFGGSAKAGIMKINFEKIGNFVDEKCKPLVSGFNTLGAITGGIIASLVASRTVKI